jgi:predicted amidohydrolase YtcJ
MTLAFVNGNIYASFKPLKIVEAFVVESSSGKVIYIGDSAGARRVVDSLGGEVVDLRGKTVLPGFVDSHVHLDQLGMDLNMLDFHGVGSIEELKQRLLEYSKRAETLWIMGFGWDQELFKEKRFPTRWDLDEVVSKRPCDAC